MRAVIRASTVRSACGSLVATSTGADATLIAIGGHTGRNRHGRRSKRTIRCGVQSSVLIRLRRSVVRHVIAPRATNVSAAGTGVAKRAHALSLLHSRSAEATKHRVDRVLPQRSADPEVQLGDTTAEGTWIDSREVHRRAGVTLAVRRARADSRREGSTPLARRWITVAARARGVIAKIGRPSWDRADRRAWPTDIGEDVRVGHGRHRR